jgi:hypothetical protein
VIAEALFHRRLRAPRTAADDIGWPDATRAMAYLQRLADSPATGAQARASAKALAEAGTTAAFVGRVPPRHRPEKARHWPLRCAHGAEADRDAAR